MAFAGGSGKGSPKDSIYVDLAAIVVPVIRNGEVQRHLGWQFSIEATDLAAAHKIRDDLPRLTSAFLQVLNGLTQRADAASGMIDPTVVKSRMLGTLARILGPGVAREVLIQKTHRRDFG